MEVSFDYNSPITTLNAIDYPTNIANFAAKTFPNPVNTLLNITVSGNASIVVKMIDMMGRTIANEQSQNGSISINTQNLAAGIYLLNIYDTEGNQQNKKVIVSH